MCLGFILLKPVVGWVAGIDLALLGKQDSKIYDGTNGSKYTDGLIVAHVSLPHGRLASIETVNIFERDPLSVIRFPKTSSEAVECTINGQPARLVDFLLSQGSGDGQRPLIGDFAGADINLSLIHI